MPLLEYQQDQGRRGCTTAKTEGSQLPRSFLFPCPCEHTQHQTNDVEGRPNVEQLEYEVPRHVRWMRPEQIEVAGAEHHGVQDLRDERDA